MAFAASETIAVAIPLAEFKAGLGRLAKQNERIARRQELAKALQADGRVERHRAEAEVVVNAAAEYETLAPNLRGDLRRAERAAAEAQTIVDKDPTPNAFTRNDPRANLTAATAEVDRVKRELSSAEAKLSKLEAERSRHLAAMRSVEVDVAARIERDARKSKPVVK